MKLRWEMREMQKIRVGIIGTGFGAKVHAPMISYHDGFEVVAIASVTRGNIEEARNTSGIQNVYTDWRLMLEMEQLDLVVVASAVNLHREMVLAAYEKGLHVLCEKPMALHKKETEEMILERDRVKRFGLINHEFRFLPARTKVKEILDSGNLGTIMHVRYSCTFPNYNSLTSNKRRWLAKEEKGGGMLGAIGSHMIDSLHWWLNSQFKEVFANLPIHIPVQVGADGDVEYRTADDAFQVIGTLENGATVSMELVSAARKVKNNFCLEIFGKQGTLVMLDDNQVFVSYEDESFKDVPLAPELTAPSTMPEAAARFYNFFHRMLDALYETIISGKKHAYLADFKDGQRIQQVLDAIRLSAKEGRKIILE